MSNVQKSQRRAAESMLSPHKVIAWVTYGAACFLFGMWAGDEAAAVALQPCPQNGKARLISATVTGQACQYAEIVRGGGKIKWTTRALDPAPKEK